MKKKIVFIALISILLFACSSSKKNTGNSQTNTVTSLQATQDGLTMETAIVINKKTEGLGIDAQYKWIKNNYSNYTIKGQR